MTIARVVLSAVASAASSATTTGVDTTGSNLLVAVVSSYASGASVTDNKGNTFTSLTQYGGGGSLCQIWYCLNPTTVGAGHTVTVGSLTTYSALCLVGYSGVSSLDRSSGSLTASPGSITPAGANELFISVAACGTTGADLTGCSGFTLAAHAAFSSGVNTAFGFAELIETTATAQNPTWTSSAGSPTSTMATFTASAGGGGSIILPPYLFDTRVS